MQFLVLFHKTKEWQHSAQWPTWSLSKESWVKGFVPVFTIPVVLTMPSPVLP